MESTKEPPPQGDTAPLASAFEGALDGAGQNVRPKRRNLGELADKITREGVTPIPYLRVFGQEGLFVRGWQHLISAFPKSGKTEFMIRNLCEWEGEKVVYFTEESEVMWEYRLNEMPEEMRRHLGHIEMVYCMGLTDAEVQEEMGASGYATIVVLDTVANIIRPKDENDNSAVSEALRPWIATFLEREQTSFLLHHDNQSGGKRGRGIRGAGAFLASVDVFVQIIPLDGNRRKVEGNGRIRQIEEKVYSLHDDGYMRWEDSQDNGLDAAVLRLKMGMTEIWARTGDFQAITMSSVDTTERALKFMAGKGWVERDPPLGEPAAGKPVKWRKVRA